MQLSIIGVTGYSGLELLRLLYNHPHVSISGLYGYSSTGRKISEIYPHLLGIIDTVVEPVNPEKIMKESDLVFFATPSGVAKEGAIPFIEANFPVIDLSGDFRLTQEDYEKWYKKAAAPQAYLEKAEYGLADFEQPQGKLIANPGCYATATLLGLAPLVQKQLIENSSIIVDAKSGLSGAGKKLSENSHFSFISDNMLLYKQNEHQHIPEILQQLQKWDKNVPYLQFQTSLIPVKRGIFVTSYAKVKAGVSEQELFHAYLQVYADKRFVRIQPQGKLPSLKQVIGSNYCDIGLAFNEETGIVTVVSVIDNLVKGAAGQAIQNMNVLAGFESDAGLMQVPVFP
ncbi:MAG: N-acetyl-gamma-glutamyl-phosphate reductase [Lactobacillales bacterium]|nr:N-acetyl-gamma-glutamyl-phosphate reductase [Lactobacillales bacterium]